VCLEYIAHARLVAQIWATLRVFVCNVLDTRICFREILGERIVVCNIPRIFVCDILGVHQHSHLERQRTAI